MLSKDDFSALIHHFLAVKIRNHLKARNCLQFGSQESLHSTYEGLLCEGLD